MKEMIFMVLQQSETNEESSLKKLMNLRYMLFHKKNYWTKILIIFVDSYSNFYEKEKCSYTLKRKLGYCINIIDKCLYSKTLYTVPLCQVFLMKLENSRSSKNLM